MFSLVWPRRRSCACTIPPPTNIRGGRMEHDEGNKIPTSESIPRQRVARPRNPWGVVAVVAATLSVAIKYLDLNSQAVEDALWNAKEPNLYIYGMGRTAVEYLPYLPLLLGVLGLLLARGRSRKSSIVGILLAGACLVM